MSTTWLYEIGVSFHGTDRALVEEVVRGLAVALLEDGIDGSMILYDVAPKVKERAREWDPHGKKDVLDFLRESFWETYLSIVFCSRWYIDPSSENTAREFEVIRRGRHVLLSLNGAFIDGSSGISHPIDKLTVPKIVKLIIAEYYAALRKGRHRLIDDPESTCEAPIPLSLNCSHCSAVSRVDLPPVRAIPQAPISPSAPPRLVGLKQSGVVGVSAVMGGIVAAAIVLLLNETPVSSSDTSASHAVSPDVAACESPPELVPDKPAEVAQAPSPDRDADGPEPRSSEAPNDSPQCVSSLACTMDEPLDQRHRCICLTPHEESPMPIGP